MKKKIKPLERQDFNDIVNESLGKAVDRINDMPMEEVTERLRIAHESKQLQRALRDNSKKRGR